MFYLSDRKRPRAKRRVQSLSPGGQRCVALSNAEACHLLLQSHEQQMASDTVEEVAQEQEDAAHNADDVAKIGAPEVCVWYDPH